MTAPFAHAVQDDDIMADHGHPPIPSADRPCEPGIRAQCRDCRRRLAPCTRSGVRVQDVKVGRWRCSECAGKGGDE